MGIIELIRHVFSQPLVHWFGAVGTFDYEIRDNHLIQKSSTGETQNICLANEIEYWSDDGRLKIVTLGLHNGQRIIVKDGAGKLASLLTKNPSLVRRRD